MTRFENCDWSDSVESNAYLGLDSLSDSVSLFGSVSEYSLPREQESTGQEGRRLENFAMINHEIRTPLAGLVGALEIIKAKTNDPEVLDILEHSLNSAQVLKRVVNDALDLSKLDAGKMEFDREPVNLRSLLKGVASMAEMQAPGRADDFDVNVDTKVPESVFGDAIRLRQILSNLVNNAIKFSERGAIKISLSVAPDGSQRDLIFSVSDQGVGIRDSDQKALFQEYSQVDKRPGKKAEGTGLGLMICKKLAEGMGGELGVDSVYGEGATFWFRIPAQAVASSTYLDGDQTHPPMVKRLQGLRFLLAEDQQIGRAVVSSYLERMGAEVVAVEDGAAALDVIHKEGPAAFDGILVDINMPKLNGFEFCKEVSAAFQAASIPPIVALTAHTLSEVSSRCGHVGITTVISKPVAFEDLELRLGHIFEVATGIKVREDRRWDQDVTYCTLPFSIAMKMDPAVFNGLRSSMSCDDIADLVRDLERRGRQTLLQMKGLFKSDPRLKPLAHQLRGISGLLGFVDMSSLCGLIEDEADHLTSEDLAEALSAIEAELDDISNA